MGIKEEVKEIYEDMKEDFRKGKEYAYQYRKTIFWIFITFIAMQFTNVLSLGASWQNMCEQNPNLKLKKVQKGGQDAESGGKVKEMTPDKVSDATLEKKAANFEKSKAEATAKLEANVAKAQEAVKQQMAEKAAYDEGKKAVEDEKAAKKEAKEEKKASRLRSFKPFQGFKELGPMSGFFSKIGSYLKGGFFIVGIIIAILVASVIPIVIFSTIMYYIIKYLSRMVSRL